MGKAGEQKQKKKQVDARRHDRINKRQTPNENEKEEKEEKQPATRLRYAPREEEEEIKEIDNIHPHQGPS